MPKQKSCRSTNKMTTIYRVGGAVRDALLGLPVKDVDYVVIGATPAQMIAEGYTPVGKDFPVFLHPISRAEYALARTERKTAAGYHGFVFHCDPEVTLEQDLQRRDLTINAMAVQEPDGLTIIDPYHGQQDLQDRIFRHVSPAFSEDPVRILRLARFAARFDDFRVAEQTLQLMRDMVNNGEVDALVAERVWQELARGLMEQTPSRMFQVLYDCGALARIMPELDWPSEQPPAGLAALDFAARLNNSRAVRWSALLLGLPLADAALTATVQRLSTRLKIPAELRDLSLMASREQQVIRSVEHLSAAELVGLLERCDALRRPERFTDVIRAVQCATLVSDAAFPAQALLARVLAAAQAIPAAAIAAQTVQDFPGQPQRIAEQISLARIAAVDAACR